MFPFAYVYSDIFIVAKQVFMQSRPLFEQINWTLIIYYI